MDQLIMYQRRSLIILLILFYFPSVMLFNPHSLCFLVSCMWLEVFHQSPLDAMSMETKRH